MTTAKTIRMLAIATTLAAAGAANAAAIDRTLYAIGFTPDTGNQALIRFDPDNPSDEEFIGELGITLPEFNVFLSYDPNDDSFLASSFDTIYRIDRYTGVTTPLMNVGTDRLQGIAYVPSLGKNVVAYGLPGDLDGGLGPFDRRIGAIEPDGTLTELANFNDGTMSGLEDFDELVYDPGTGDLFGHRFIGSEWFRVDPDTWTIVDRGVYAGTPRVFRGDVNPENGELYFDGANVTPDPGGTIFEGQLDIWRRTLPDYTLGASTGSISLLENIDGLAFVPAPGAAVLVGLAGLAASRRRR